MTSSAPEPSRPSPASRPGGFTLLELVVSLTITTMVTLVIYSAFALGTRVWERQGQEDQDLRREEVMLRLLDQDVAGMTAYNTRWEGADLSFFAGSPTVLFYVTGNGFGALRRQDKALFFSCLFVGQDENGQEGLFLYKIPEPGPDLVREVRGFLGASSAGRAVYGVPEPIRRQAVRIADGYANLSFSYSGDRLVPFGGPPQDAMERSLTADEDDLDQEKWTTIGLPGQIQLRYGRDQAEPSRVLLIPGLGVF